MNMHLSGTGPVLIKPICSVWIQPVGILCGFPVNSPICVYFYKVICQQSWVSVIELCTITRWKNILLSHSECWWPEARFQPNFPPSRICHSAQFDNTNQWSSCFSSTPAIFCNVIHARLTGGSLFRNVNSLWKWPYARVWVCMCVCVSCSFPALHPSSLINSSCVLLPAAIN